MICIPFTSPDATLQNAGGKGANLARLARAGFPVPPGFILATDAYRAFVDANSLGGSIRSALAGTRLDDPDSIERASGAIRAAFVEGEIPAEVRHAIRAAYEPLQDGPVAVRSSATAEDLPDLSFAGQQDTYLNVTGLEGLLGAVVRCWGSLWTGRAIGYRMRNGIEGMETALAVVVQHMVPSEVSGVLFTANPLTGLRSETVIDATFGLGEALVSGQVEPDHYVVASPSGEIREIRLGAKQVVTRSVPGGGVESVQDAAGERQALPDEGIRQLARLGQEVQAEYGAPQDIEWAFAGGALYLLQARPITSLFPVPQVSFDPLKVWFSFGAVQGLTGPLTPLGSDAILQVVSSAGKVFGLHLRPEETDLFGRAGERIWVKISDMMRNPLGVRALGGALGFIEPSVGQIIRTLMREPRIGAGRGKVKPGSVLRVLRFALPVLVQLMRTVLRPASARRRFDAVIDGYLAGATIPPAADRFERLAHVTAFIRDRVANSLPFLLPRFVPIFGPGVASLNLLNRIAGDERALVLEVTRGLPDNVTTEMDLALWSAAAAVRADPDARDLFDTAGAPELARRFLEGSLPPAAQRAIAPFMGRYGMRGVGEIDLGQPRWREDPTPVMHTLKSYLSIPPASAPDAQFARGQVAAATAIEKLARLARSQHGGRWKEKLARAAARRMRALMGARESPKFMMVRVMGVARSALLEAGAGFTAAGTLTRADDLSFFYLDELDALAAGETRDWKALVAERRSIYERENRRRQVPRVIVSDGRVFYEGVGAHSDSGDTITGSPVSPGVAEGPVRVVLDPRSAQLSPGEILVCPGTDPAWTPLFLAAGGLVTEVGGVMTHGSVVAREYGIPAVVGVHQATLRLQDGQRVRVDGSTGKITLLSR